MSVWAKRDKKWREKLSWLFITTQYTRSQEAYTCLTLTTNKIIYYKFHFWTNLINRQLQLCYLAKKLSKYCNIHIRAKPEILKLKKKLYGLFFWMGFNCLAATGPLQGDSLLFTNKSSEIRGTHLIDLERMKGWVDIGATQWFWT